MSGKIDLSRFVPLHGFVLVRYRPLPDECRIGSGDIVVPAGWAKKRARVRVADVIRLGKNLVTRKGAIIPHGVKVGDVILTDRKYGSLLDENDPELRLVSEDQILGVIEGDVSGIDLMATQDLTERFQQKSL